jgi:hypothetical protein
VAGPRTPTDVMPNKFVEANGFAREVVERGFRFSPRNLGVFAVFGVAVPVLIYQGCVSEFVRARGDPENRTPPIVPIRTDSTDRRERRRGTGPARSPRAPPEEGASTLARAPRREPIRSNPKTDSFASSFLVSCATLETDPPPANVPPVRPS